MKPYQLLLPLLFCVTSLRAQNAEPDTNRLVIGEKIFEKVESEAEFPGGNRAWIAFLEKNLNPNVPVDHGAPAGRYMVLVQFVVDKEGNISDIKALTQMGFGMEDEVIRIMRKSGKWTPAYQNHRPVKAYRKQPVTFQVEDENFVITSERPWVLQKQVDNIVTIEADKVRDDDLEVTVSNGTITKLGNGRYNIRPGRSGRVVITLYNSRKRKQIGAASFEVYDK